MKKLIVILCLALFAVTLQAQGPTGRAVTQITSPTTAVTINTETGVITTVTETAAGASATTFTVNNSAVTATSTVQAGVQGYTGSIPTAGMPVVVVSNVVAGAFNVNILNVHASAALNGILQIGFIIR